MNKKSKLAPRRGGRPSREQANKLQDIILDAAADLFFSEGYGATSIEAVAKRARITKRTLYVRFPDKAELFRGVVRRVISNVRPPDIDLDRLFSGVDLRETLGRVARLILHASLSEETLSLHRVIVAEATRFPEVAIIMHEQRSRHEAITRISKLLGKEVGEEKARFAAEQFLFMVTAGPQRRALGLGPTLNDEELDDWADKTVDLFLDGCLKK